MQRFEAPSITDQVGTRLPVRCFFQVDAEIFGPLRNRLIKNGGEAVDFGAARNISAEN